MILPKDVLERVGEDERSTCEAIMETAQFAPEIWRVGKTKVFMKESDMVSYKIICYHRHLLFKVAMDRLIIVIKLSLFKISQLENLRSDALYWFAVKIQSVVRGFLARKYCRKLKEMIKGKLFCAFWLNKTKLISSHLLKSFLSASKVITKALRNYGEMKRFNYRLSIKQYLKSKKHCSFKFDIFTLSLSPSLSIIIRSPPTTITPCFTVVVVIDFLVSENAKLAENGPEELNEMLEPTEISEPKPLIFTHEETTDHVGYYFNEALQNMTGKNVFECSSLIVCELMITAFTLHR